ncbi:MAG: C-GCAxxG-C-C family protein [Oscillospiraceae bacterium]|nr:C-GCAxxG-C-C family protein [Oscillospiraceae bacterium]
MTHEEKALAYFKEKFHCSQSVFAAYAEELGITEEQALKIGYCFNSGMRKGEVCGACSGALLVIGAKYGQSDKNDLESRTRANHLTMLFLDRFKEENGSYICNNLLGCDITTPEGGKYALENGLYTSVCPKMVASAVTILEEIIKTEEQK